MVDAQLENSCSGGQRFSSTAPLHYSTAALHSSTLLQHSSTAALQHSSTALQWWATAPATQCNQMHNCSPTPTTILQCTTTTVVVHQCPTECTSSAVVGQWKHLQNCVTNIRMYFDNFHKAGLISLKLYCSDRIVSAPQF